MFWLVLGMMLAVALAGFVVGIVALPARRAGRPILTPRGERLLKLGDDYATRGGDRAGAAAERARTMGERAKARATKR